MTGFWCFMLAVELLIPLAMLLVGALALSILPVERALKRAFDENGNWREGEHPSDTPAL